MRLSPSIELGEIMASNSGSVDPSKYPDEIFDLYSVPAFDNRHPEVVPGRAIGSNKQIVAPGDVLLSKIVPHIRRSWVVGNKRGRRIIASGEWIVFRSKLIEPSYFRHVLVGDPFHIQFMQTVSGVGGSLLRARQLMLRRSKFHYLHCLNSVELQRCWIGWMPCVPNAVTASPNSIYSPNPSSSNSLATRPRILRGSR